MTQKDILAEYRTGEMGAIQMIGKFIIQPSGQDVNGFPLTAIVGTAIAPAVGKIVLPVNEYKKEMWECEILIIPKRKYSGTDITNIDRHAPYNGWKIGDVLTEPDFGEGDNWGIKYFDSFDAKDNE